MKDVIEFMQIEVQRCKEVSYRSKKNGDYVIEEYYNRRVERFIEAISLLKAGNKQVT